MAAEILLFELPGSDFAGQELTRIRFIVNEVLIEPRPGGGSQSTYSVRFEFLGR